MFDRSVFRFDLHKRDHVKLFKSLRSFGFKLSSIRRILPNLIDDHVKHVFEPFKLRRDRVKLRAKLPCLEAITSDFVMNLT